MNKKLLTAAVGAAVGFGLSAPSIAAPMVALVPYVIKDNNATTVVTLIGNGAPKSQNDTVHLQYWTKAITDANTASCKPSSVFVPFTDNDIMTFDTAGILGYPLFGDTSNAAPLGTSIAYSQSHGYLVIDNRSDNFNALYWLQLDLANGGAVGDIGLRSSAVGGTGNYRNDNFNIGNGLASQADPNLGNHLRGVTGFNSLHVGDVATQIAWNSAADAGEPYGLTDGSDHIARAVNFWPSSVATTVFTVTPAGTAMLTKENNQVILQVLNSNNVQGAYDRNENGVDGTVPVTVRCVGRVTPAQLMPGVVSNAAWAAQGGWGWLANLGDGDTNYSEGGSSDLRAVVYQVDGSSAGGKFISNATRITSLDF